MYRNSIIYLISDIILKGAIVLLLPFYSHLIKPNEFGVIFIVQIINSFLIALISLSLRGSISRFYFDCERDEDIKKMYSSIIYFLTLFSICAYSILLFGSQSISYFFEIKVIYIRIGLISSFLGFFLPHLYALLIVQEKAKKMSLIIIFVGIFGLILNIIFVIYFTDKIFGFLMAQLTISLICFIIFWFLSYRFLIGKIQINKIKDYIKYGLHLLPGDMAVWTINFADRFMINKFCGATTAGIYIFGYKIGQSQEMIQNSINKAYVPYIFSRYKNLTKQNERELNSRALELFAFFTIIAFFAIVFIKDFIILLDKNYKNIYLFFPIIVMSYLLGGYKIIFHNPLAYNKKFAKYKSLIWIFAAILNIVLNYVFIKKYSYWGASLATFVSFLFALILTLILINKAIKIQYEKKKFIYVLIFSCIYSILFFLECSVMNFMIKIFSTIVYIVILSKLTGLNLFIIKSFMWIKQNVKIIS